MSDSSNFAFPAFMFMMVMFFVIFAWHMGDKRNEIEAREKQSIEDRITAIEDQLILIGKGK